MMELTAELSAAVWWSTILLIKLATAGLLVAPARLTRKVFSNPEDSTFHGGKPEDVKLNDEVVERRRRLVTFTEIT